MWGTRVKSSLFLLVLFALAAILVSPATPSPPATDVLLSLLAVMAFALLVAIAAVPLPAPSRFRWNSLFSASSPRSLSLENAPPLRR